MITIGTRCYENHRGGDTVPRGGVVIDVWTSQRKCLVMQAYGWRTEGRRHRMVIDTAVLELRCIDWDTVEPIGDLERIAVARVVAAAIGDRRATGRTPADDHDLFVLAELMRPAPPGLTAHRSVTERGRCLVCNRPWNDPVHGDVDDDLVPVRAHAADDGMPAASEVSVAG